MKNKSSNTMQNIANYTRSKDAYDGNMEITNLRSSSQKITSASTHDSKILSESPMPGEKISDKK